MDGWMDVGFLAAPMYMTCFSLSVLLLEQRFSVVRLSLTPGRTGDGANPDCLSLKVSVQLSIVCQY